ncbi:DUF1707 domain-containing protein [Pseudonocardia kongjuensis]|uniref:DUF1707 domain-containing protein n=1 Tax=Pseudonocardia kongjuensis TaxID=102227 RepID=A0ABP4IWB1_9PSEU
MSTGDLGHAEQEDAVRALSLHFTGGRLEVGAFDERVRRARAAGSWAELAALFTDLPEPHPDFPPGVRPGEGGATAAPPADGTSAGSAGATAAYPAGGATGPGPDHRTAPPWPPAHGARQPAFPGFAPGHESTPAWYDGYPNAYPPHPGPPVYGAYAGYDAAAPFGREPYSGRPYSDRQRIVGGLLQLFLPFGVGRFYTGHTGLAVAQLLVTLFTFGFGAIWSFVDGIVILAGSPTDPAGRPLRP